VLGRERLASVDGVGRRQEGARPVIMWSFGRDDL